MSFLISWSIPGDSSSHSAMGVQRGSFSGRSKPTPPLPASRQSYKTSGITCQWCNKDQHTTKKCHKLGKVLKKAKAGGLIEAFASTSLKDSSDTGWCTDTGATSHMTNDTAVLDEFSPYNGNQRVFMGNGQPLSIPRTGSTSSLIASKSLKIYDALLVPCITKKLFSTSKLTRENNCIMFWFYHTGSIWQQEWLGIRHCEKGLYIIDCGHTSFMSSISLG
jgi:hypothetical protein